MLSQSLTPSAIRHPMCDRDVVTSYPTGHISSPDDLHVSPGVRVAFAPFGQPSARYSADNAIVMRFVDAATGSAVPAPLPPPVRIEAEDEGAWTELRPRAMKDVAERGSREYLIELGRAYRALSSDGTPLFELRPPPPRHPRRELVRVVRHAASYGPRAQRLMREEE